MGVGGVAVMAVAWDVARFHWIAHIPYRLHNKPYNIAEYII